MTPQILVTGAAGCVGQACLKQLNSAKAEVIGLDLASLPAAEFAGRWVLGDICDPESYWDALSGIDVVIHLAAKVHSIPRTRDEAAGFWRVNLDGTRNLISSAVKNGVRRFVHVSTVAVLAPITGNPESAYADSKRASEQEVLNFRDRIEVVIVRPTTVYGPHDRGNVYKLIRWVDKGLPAMIGSGDNRKSLVYTRNLANALIFLSNRGENGNIYTVTDGCDLSMREILLVISKALDKGHRIYSIPQGVVKSAAVINKLLAKWLNLPEFFGQGMIEKFTAETVFDASALFSLGFAPTYSFDKGIEETIRWYKDSAS